jgi:hypothetical protein
MIDYLNHGLEVGDENTDSELLLALTSDFNLRFSQSSVRQIITSEVYQLRTFKGTKTFHGASQNNSY